MYEFTKRLCAFILLSAFLALVFALGACSSIASTESNLNAVSVLKQDGTTAAQFIVEIERTPKEQAIGLQNRTSLDRDRGMLFVFPGTGSLVFWNKAVLFPIDIIFADSSGRIRTIHRDVPPCAETNTDCPLYGTEPGKDAQYVLEINGGQSNQLHIETGDMLHGAAIPGT